MSLRNLLFDSNALATATPATVATPETEKSVTVASVATVAVAKPKNSKTSKPVSTPKTIADPVGPCRDCGSGQWWQLARQAWHCRACEPDMPLTATTLTLACHKEQVPRVGSHAGLDRMIEIACEGLSITPAQLHAELREGGDIPDLVSGGLTLQALRLTARTLALMRYPHAASNVSTEEQGANRC
jgi:hypothetical protein